MNTALWVVQVVLAALYVMAGVWKVTGQGPMLEKMMPGFSLALIRLVGLGEALVGLGLVLPAAARSWVAVAGWAGAILAVEAAVFVVYHLLTFGTGLLCPPEPRSSWASWPLLWPGEGSNEKSSRRDGVPDQLLWPCTRRACHDRDSTPSTCCTCW